MGRKPKEVVVVEEPAVVPSGAAVVTVDLTLDPNDPRLK